MVIDNSLYPNFVTLFSYNCDHNCSIPIFVISFTRLNTYAFATPHKDLISEWVVIRPTNVQQNSICFIGSCLNIDI